MRSYEIYINIYIYTYMHGIYKKAHKLRCQRKHLNPTSICWQWLNQHQEREKAVSRHYRASRRERDRILSSSSVGFLGGNRGGKGYGKMREKRQHTWKTTGWIVGKSEKLLLWKGKSLFEEEFSDENSAFKVRRSVSLIGWLRSSFVTSNTSGFSFSALKLMRMVKILQRFIGELWLA